MRRISLAAVLLLGASGSALAQGSPGWQSRTNNPACAGSAAALSNPACKPILAQDFDTAFGAKADLMMMARGSTTARDLRDRFAETLNVRDYGAQLDGVTDDSDAFLTAAAAAQRLLNIGHSVKIDIGVGSLVLKKPIVLNALQASVGLVGAGRGMTKIVVQAPIDALRINVSASTGAVVDDFSLERQVIGPSATTANIGLDIESGEQQTDGQVAVGSMFLGNDSNLASSQSWKTALKLSTLAVATIDKIKTFQPYVGMSDDGSSGIYFTGTPTGRYGINLKISNSTMQGGWAGLRVGDWVQGVFGDNLDILGGTVGVQWVPDADTGTEYLSLSNSHLNPSLYGVNIADGDGLIEGCYILQFNQGGGFVGVNYRNMANLHILGTMMRGTGGFGQNNKGIVASGPSQWGQIVGDGFDGFQTAVELDDSSWATVVGNSFPNNVNKLVDNAKNPLTEFLDLSASMDGNGNLVFKSPILAPTMTATGNILAGAAVITQTPGGTLGSYFHSDTLGDFVIGNGQAGASTLIAQKVMASAPGGSGVEEIGQNVQLDGTTTAGTLKVSGSLYLPSTSSNPVTTAPLANLGLAQAVVDTTDSKLCVYLGSAWKCAALQ